MLIFSNSAAASINPSLGPGFDTAINQMLVRSSGHRRRKKKRSRFLYLLAAESIIWALLNISTRLCRIDTTADD